MLGQTSSLVDVKYQSAYGGFAKTYVYRYLYAQFIAMVLGSLRYEWENEVLYVIHIINQQLMLHSESAVSQYESHAEFGRKLREERVGDNG